MKASSLLIRRTAVSAALAVVVALMSASVATAQPRTDADGYRNARRLGGTTSFYRPALTNPASLKRMASTKGMADDIRKVLSDAGISDTSDAVVAMLSGGAPSTKGGSCAGATPADGVLMECDFPVGSTLEWMAYRPNIGRGDRTPGMINKFRWAGAKPFGAFLFRVTNSRGVYTFVVPKPCGNLSLMNFAEARRETPAPPPPPPRRRRASAATAAARLASSRPRRFRRLHRRRPRPWPAVKASPFFFDILAGKERRVARPRRSKPLVAGGASPTREPANTPSAHRCSASSSASASVLERRRAQWRGWPRPQPRQRRRQGARARGVRRPRTEQVHRQGLHRHRSHHLGLHQRDRAWLAAALRRAAQQQREAPGPLRRPEPAVLRDGLQDNYLLWGGIRVHF